MTPEGLVRLHLQIRSCHDPTAPRHEFGCQPYQIQRPIRAKKQWYTLDADGAKDKLMTREGEIRDVRDIFKF